MKTAAVKYQCPLLGRLFKTLALIAIVSSIATPTIAAWTQFQGDAGHTGYAVSSGVPQLTLPTWTVTTVRFFDPTPAVRFYPGIASDGQNVFVSWLGNPSTVSGVNAVNIATGAEAWEWKFSGNDAEELSAPAYENGKLYVHRWGHSSSCGVTCNDKPRLFGINATNGTQLFDRTHSGQWSSGGRPTASGGNVYVAGGYYGGLDNYNGATGNIDWFASMPQEYGWIPAAYGDKVFTSFFGNLTVVNKTTGGAQTLLSPTAGGYNASTPTVVSPNEAYVPYANTITQFDPANNYATWQYKILNGSVANQGMAVGNSALYANLGSSVTAIDRKTGNFLWAWPTSDFTTSNLVLTNTHLFVASSTTTYAISLATHATDWSAPYGGLLALDSGYLFVSNTNALHAFAVGVPEPSAMLLILSCVAFLVGFRKR